MFLKKGYFKKTEYKSDLKQNEKHIIKPEKYQLEKNAGVSKINMKQECCIVLSYGTC